MSRRTVAILYRYIPRYRLPFYEQLYKIAALRGIDICVIYGDPGREDRTKNDKSDFAQGIYRPSRFLHIGRKDIVWQPVLDLLRGADLIVVEQANKLLINYLLIARQFLGGAKLAFWGHGRNFQATRTDAISEWLKAAMTRWPFWWFTYTQGTAKIIAERGFPAERITVVNNAIDSRDLEADRASVTDADIQALRAEKGLFSSRIGIYSGGIYAEKRIDFLLQACERIRARIPDFQMIIMGSGPQDDMVRAFCAERPWCVYVGPAYGREKARNFAVSKVLLMPGAVGLVVLDAMLLGVPMVTTDMPLHGPEIEYLEDGVTGIIASPFGDVEAYADAVCGLLEDEDRRRAMVEAGRRAASTYSIENMVQLFLAGIEAALAAK